MIKDTRIVHNKASRKELQDKIKKALANKPTAASQANHTAAIAPMAAAPRPAFQQRPVVKSVKKNVNTRPRSEGKPTSASFTTGEAYLLEQESRRRNMPAFKPIEPFPQDYIGTFKHSGDLGDLWYSLPIIKHMGKGDIFLAIDGLKSTKCDGTASGLIQKVIDMAKPLLEAQDYIRHCKTWKKEKVDIDMDTFRRVNLYGDINLCELILKNCGVPYKAATEPWLTCKKNRVAARVFARSPRYHNSNVKWDEIYNAYKTDAVFVGLPYEHQAFENAIGLISYQPVKNFLEMAEIINGADLFIGNQSSPMAMAIGLGKAFIQEVCPMCPNCMFTRENAKYLT
jgi:hypothetical protein